MKDESPVGLDGPYPLQATLACVAVWLGLFAAIQHPGYLSAFFEPRAAFHYYVGAKYFDEIGPFDLYQCAIAADREANPTWGPETPVRDLHSYAMVTAGSLSCPADRFTRERWESFVRDVSWFTHTATPADWALALTDKGYNASPFFSEVVGRLVNFTAPLPRDAARPPFVVFNLDLLFVASAIWIVWRSAGATVALVVLVLALGFFGNFGRIGGNLAQYVWFPFVALAVAEWRGRRPAAGGAALGIATGFQIFPAFFALPVVITGARSLFRRDRDASRKSLRFSASFAIVVGLCVAIGSASPAGFGAWRAWQQKMTVHSTYLRGEVFDIGLSNVIGYALSADRESSDSYDHDIPHSRARQTALDEHRALWFSLTAVMIALFIAAVWAVPDESALAFGIVPLYALLALSPYYYFVLTLLPFMAIGIPCKRYKVLIAALGVLFALNLAIWNGSYISFSYGGHAITQSLVAVFILSAALTPVIPAGAPRSAG